MTLTFFQSWKCFLKQEIGCLPIFVVCFCEKVLYFTHFWEINFDTIFFLHISCNGYAICFDNVLCMLRAYSVLRKQPFVLDIQFRMIFHLGESGLSLNTLYPFHAHFMFNNVCYIIYTLDIITCVQQIWQSWMVKWVCFDNVSHMICAYIVLRKQPFVLDIQFRVTFHLSESGLPLSTLCPFCTYFMFNNVCYIISARLCNVTDF